MSSPPVCHGMGLNYRWGDSIYTVAKDHNALIDFATISGIHLGPDGYTCAVCHGTWAKSASAANDGILLSAQVMLFNSNDRSTNYEHMDSMLLDDLGDRFGADHVLHYMSCDYHMPLLQGNEHYRRWVNDMTPAFATIGRPLLRCIIFSPLCSP